MLAIHSLPDITDWEAHEAARLNLFPFLSLSPPAVRYRVTAAQAEVIRSLNCGSVLDF